MAIMETAKVAGFSLILALIVLPINSGAQELIKAGESGYELLVEPLDPENSYQSIKGDLMLLSDQVAETSENLPLQMTPSKEFRYRVDTLSQYGRTWTETYIETYIGGEKYYRSMTDGSDNHETFIPLITI